MLLKLFLSFLGYFVFSSTLFGANTHYVNTSTLKVRLGATTKAHHSYSIYKGHRVKVYELVDGWARISRYKNSVVDGKFNKRAHWVYAEYLTKIIQNTEKKEIIEKQIEKESLQDNSKTHFVHANKLKVRLGSNKHATHSYSLNKNDRVKVFELKNGWARISPFKENIAQWVFAKYLTKIPTETIKVSKTEPIVKVAEQKIETKPVTDEQIIEEVQTLETLEDEDTVNDVIDSLQSQSISQEYLGVDPLLYEAINSSDKFEIYKDIFIKTSQRLYEKGTCQLRDFKRTKGWIEISDNVLFFIYCGKIKRSNKIYLNVVTGEATK